MMGVNSLYYVGSTWPSNEDSCNWDAGLLCSWNAGLSSAFNCWGNAGRGSWASRLGAMVVLKRKLQTLCRTSHLRRRSWASRLGVVVVLERELQTLCRASRLRRGSWASRLGAAVVLKSELQTLYWASRVRRGLQALCLSTEVVLRRGLWFLRPCIVVVSRCGLRALHLGSARVALISLAFEAWILLFDDLSSVIFRQSTCIDKFES